MTHYTGDKLPPYYIGSTSVKNIENGYNGSPSSKKYCSIWNEERKNNPHLFKTTILNRHSTREEAYLDENKWQTKLNVVESDLFVNRSVQTSTGFTCTSISEEHKQAISKANSGLKRTPEQRQRTSEIQKTKVGDKNQFYGKTHSEETKRKLSKARMGKAPWNKGLKKAS